MLLDTIDVEAGDLIDCLIEIKDARGALNVLQLDRQRTAFIWIERYSEGFLETREVRQMQAIRLFTFSGRWNRNDGLQLARPRAKMRNAVAGADHPDTDFARPLRLSVRSIKEQTILRVRLRCA